MLKLSLYPFCVAIQLVDVIVLIDLGSVHLFVLPHLPSFLNCVTPALKQRERLA
jgi:hypothetical protein